MQVKCTHCNGTGVMEKESIDEAVDRYYAQALEELMDESGEAELSRSINISYDNPVSLRVIKDKLIERLKNEKKISGSSHLNPKRNYNGDHYWQTIYLGLIKSEKKNDNGIHKYS